ncbi:uncharacterized protein BX663DRAFT_499629 [Cokeromyces recurvatus]|uniref:uncharacterized protein n=1 Tax=Cokeromyces recurvatus TaxID=90255 RepID=UPI00222016FD|nr:uncharacterized protein BX663DRAFT_499629 [Cokeromyces recurvatus]KAI7905411.1 hypothetical protein BX663DRAFT_499629 [Cokeromyces recurvatus]
MLHIEAFLYLYRYYQLPNKEKKTFLKLILLRFLAWIFHLQTMSRNNLHQYILH